MTGFCRDNLCCVIVILDYIEYKYPELIIVIDVHFITISMWALIASKNKIHKKELWAYGTLTFLAQDVDGTNLVRPLWQYDG